MSLRVRLALGFAAVALGTAAVVALATPFVVRHGFERLGALEASPGAGQPSGRGSGLGAGPLRAGQVEEETILTLVLVAAGAAVAASLLGVAAAGVLVRPLDRLRRAAGELAAGDLSRRSGIGERRDELGEVGRAFDRMAAELESADQSRRRFLQDVAHELKTPLAVIEATTSAILDGVYTAESARIESLRREGRLLARIVDDLRTISLAEGGGLALQPVWLEVDALVAEIERAHDPRARAAGVRLRATSEPGLGVEADADRLRQVLGVLIDNAIRHTTAGGQVSIAASGRDDGLRLEVTDTGPGIAPADLPHVFERFYRADPARARDTGSSGLGLAIAKSLVEAHGGAIGAANVPGGGARFWIDLPRQPTAAGRSAG
ncbi:MAG: ATP-binding protein [Chloroflexota bacterium]